MEDFDVIMQNEQGMKALINQKELAIQPFQAIVT